MLAAVEIAIHTESDDLTGRSLHSVATTTCAGRRARNERSRAVGDASYRLGQGSAGRVTTIPDLERASPGRPSRGLVCRSDGLSSFGARGLAEARTLCRLSAVEAETLISEPPFVIVEGQSRGEAEELVSMLNREKVTARPVERAVRHP